jgi:hypothetical protein
MNRNITGHDRIHWLWGWWWNAFIVSLARTTSFVAPSFWRPSKLLFILFIAFLLFLSLIGNRKLNGFRLQVDRLLSTCILLGFKLKNPRPANRRRHSFPYNNAWFVAATWWKYLGIVTSIWPSLSTYKLNG